MSGGGIARGRLAEERKAWRKNHPHGFVAKPDNAPDGSLDLMVWKCIIPGKPGFTRNGFLHIGVAMPCWSMQLQAAEPFTLIVFGARLIHLEIDMFIADLITQSLHPHLKTKLIGRVASSPSIFISVRTTLANLQSASSPKVSSIPNVYPSGTVCLSILNEDYGWRPAITVKQILIGIQDLLDQPNPSDPAQTDGYQLFVQDPTEYRRRVRQQAKLYPPTL
ncbi:UBIQUITIN-CONJUGATING ENZYME E2 [Salix koriyanagi]|uniref:UBIQUITIN-CONJUGATING ENZYME E2 n=1 Tax=Salix koriyanagi TaxID=2511006 RepID=A0A9Q0YSW3_9ROSI|nr:UBIQUITIN-CONJUGATING ENZYME E2 [Salix koriyanagi]